jgi:hypothetical protein
LFVTISEDRAVAVKASRDPDRWRLMFEDLIGRVACRFTRVDPRRWVRALLERLLAELPRKNCWTLAE